MVIKVGDGDSHCHQFSVIRPYLTSSQCHPEEGVYEKVNEDTWHRHMNDRGQIEDDFHLRKVCSNMVASTWLGDHQGRPSAPLIRCIKPSKYGALANTLELLFVLSLLSQRNPDMPILFKL